MIVQAGGKGTRLEQYSWNKPKCLVPVDGKPLLYHTFDAFPGARFIVVLDYRHDIVERFLSVFRPEVPVELVQVSGGRGNLAGIAEGARRAPPEGRVAVVWCDLRFTEPPALPESPDVIVATTRAFPCRWSFDEDGRLLERRSDTDGVMGFFGFPDRSLLLTAPAEGEFVAWLAGGDFPVRRAEFNAAQEIGTVAALASQWAASGHARFFNSVEFQPDRVVKTARVPAFQPLLEEEAAWYREAEALGVTCIPRVLGYEPLTLERIHGRHPFDLPPSHRGKSALLTRIVERLDALHGNGTGPADDAVVDQVYRIKTWDRLRFVRALLPELSEQETIRINAVPCRNILHPRHEGLVAEAARLVRPDRFRFCHGDPTFSNTLVRDDGEPVFIDPRGRFGTSWFLGDANYDWAKLYYSVVGDYDAFNRRQFVLEMGGGEAELQINGGGWRHLHGVLRDVLGDELPKVRILHALIWLSLSGYVQDDYDSMLAAYFNGLLHLEEALS